eukprot:Nitzschia sp. Nitz4//scaffold11_size288233//180655//181172//NITZ4_000789-RA/size288233-snap-gene-0.53-mRNA-1//-1//CDS//3329534119//3295//frame0
MNSSFFLRFFAFVALLVANAMAESPKDQPMSTGETALAFINRKIETHDVMVFARSYGPHNHQTKALLTAISQETNTQVEFLDLDLLPAWDGTLVTMELEAMTGQWVLPNIFIGKKHVGGNKEIDQLHALGDLKEMVEKAGQDL